MFVYRNNDRYIFDTIMDGNRVNFKGWQPYLYGYFMLLYTLCSQCIVLHIRSIRIKIINRFFVILVGISCGPTIPYAFIYMNSYYQQLFSFASSMFLMVFRFGLWYFSCHFPILLWICVALTNPYPVSFLSFFFFFFFSFASISLSTFILSLHLSTECSHIHSLYPWYKWMVFFSVKP